MVLRLLVTPGAGGIFGAAKKNLAALSQIVMKLLLWWRRAAPKSMLKFRNSWVAGGDLEWSGRRCWCGNNEPWKSREQCSVSLLYDYKVKRKKKKRGIPKLSRLERLCCSCRYIPVAWSWMAKCGWCMMVYGGTVGVLGCLCCCAHSSCSMWAWWETWANFLMWLIYLGTLKIRVMICRLERNVHGYENKLLYRGCKKTNKKRHIKAYLYWLCCFIFPCQEWMQVTL